MQLQVGKTYIARGGLEFLIDGYTQGVDFPFYNETKGECWTDAGEFMRGTPHALDLVAEVKTAGTGFTTNKRSLFSNRHPMHSNTDPEHRWPLTLPVESRTHLANVLAARREATDIWRAKHLGSKQQEIPHRDFLRMIGLAIDPTVFSKLMSEKGYPGGTAEGLLAQLTVAVDQWRMARAYAQLAPQRETLVLPWYADLEDAVRASSAMEEQGIQERAVALLAPSGGSKTTLARWLSARVGRCHIISAHESWRKSYFAVLASILTSLGQKVPHSERKAEAALLDHLRENKLTLIFDEQDFFGRSALNLIRHILNETRASVFLLMLPETWDRLVRDGGEYATQFCRRCCEVRKTPRLTQKEALLFLRESLPEATAEDLRPAAKTLAEQANIFGGLSLLDTVCSFLARHPLPPGETLEAKALQMALIYRTRRTLAINIDAHAAA